jgi:hypothetical protein
MTESVKDLFTDSQLLKLREKLKDIFDGLPWCDDFVQILPNTLLEPTDHIPLCASVILTSDGARVRCSRIITRTYTPTSADGHLRRCFFCGTGGVSSPDFSYVRLLYRKPSPIGEG